MKIIAVIAFALVIVGCASGGDEPTVDDITNRLSTEYVGLSFAVFVNNNGGPVSKIDDPASNTTIYTWLSPPDSDVCKLSIDVATPTNLIKRITILSSETDSVDTFWFFHHKYVEACKAVK